MNAEESNRFEDIKKALENHDPVLAASITRKYLEDTKNIPLNIAVTGESGSGKSTFVNAFRGIDDTDERAARTGVVETTKKPEPYPHPIHPKVTLWDLPGIGTTKFPADQYLEYVEFEKFDFFIIISADRIKENDVKLAQEIKKMGKNFYFVRSKIDNNVRDAKRSQREYKEEKTLQQIRENCIQGLKEQGVASPQVFLVSCVDLHLYDFHALQETMERDLPSHKRHVLTLALPNISKSIIIKKKEVLASEIKYYALLSAGVAAVPIPGLSIAADTGILIKVISGYLSVFGLDAQMVKRSTEGKPLADLMAGFQCPFSGNVLTVRVLLALMSTLPFVMAAESAEEGSRFIPFVGSIIAATLSYIVTYKFLNYVLDSIAADAEYFLEKALGIH